MGKPGKAGTAGTHGWPSSNIAEVPRMRCTHYACRCARAAQLAAMADRPGQGHLLLQAIGVHAGEVECRLPWTSAAPVRGAGVRLSAKDERTG